MKILIVQIGHLGDMILATPVFVAIKRAYPTAELHVLASHRNYHLAESHPLIDKVFTYRKRLDVIVRLICDIWRERYDWWIDPKDHGSSESQFWCRVSGVNHTVGSNDIGSSVPFQYSVPDAHSNDAMLPYPKHCIERNLQSLSWLKVDIDDATTLLPVLPISPESAEYVQQVLINWSAEYSLYSLTHQSFVICNLSAGSPNRYWTQQNWILVVRFLLTRNHFIILTSMPSDRELANAIRTTTSDAVCIFPSRSIHDVVALIASAHLVITPDTSAVHIASAFDVPCIALFHSIWWNRYKFAPRSSRSWVVQSPSPSESVQDVRLDHVIRCVEEWELYNQQVGDV
jgi:ADP-heptose:LPS heptosyltransferase